MLNVIECTGYLEIVGQQEDMRDNFEWKITGKHGGKRLDSTQFSVTPS